jgi:hypothetical protein
MTYPVPTTEPTVLRAGDSWQWKRSDLDDYPPSAGWALSYTLINATSKISFAATGSGTTYTVNVAASATSAYTTGVYDWVARISLGGEVHTVATGKITVLASFAASTLDNRTQAKRTLDAINATIEGRASTDQQKIEIGGRLLWRTPIPELLVLRDRYVAIVNKEQDAEDIANGRGSRKRFFVRFGGVA